MNEQINVGKESKVMTKGYVTPKFVVVAAVAAGAGAYLIGRSRGFERGISEGRKMGYMDAVMDVREIANDFKKSL